MVLCSYPVLITGFLFLHLATAGGQTTNAGTRFAFALPPSYYTYNGELELLATQATAVTILYPYWITDSLDLEPNVRTSYLVDYRHMVTSGTEEKGIVILADNPVTVSLSPQSIYIRYQEPTMLRPMPTEDDNFSTDTYLASYSPGVSITSETYRPRSFYMVVGNEDDTVVDLYVKNEGGHELNKSFTLDRNQVYTEDAYYGGNLSYDFTGDFIRTNKPVAVFSGHGCAKLPASSSDGNSRYVFESMPRSGEIGMSYLTFPLHYGENADSYETRIIAVSNDTEFAIPALEYSGVLDAGSFHQFRFISSRHGTPITCSRPCMVVEYANTASSGGPGNDHMNPCMAVLVPREHYSSSINFSVPSIEVWPALSIVTDFEPIDDLYLDGELLMLDWGRAPFGGGWYATMELYSPDAHWLYTLNSSNRFTAYLHDQYSDYWGYCYAVGFLVQ